MKQISNTAKNILTAIENKRVTPRSKWYFVLRNSVLWMPGIVTTVLGAYTIAGVLYGILHIQVVQGKYIEAGNPIFMVAAIPLLWVVSFGLFSIISISLLRKTYAGYRHTTLQLLLVSVACSIILGILFYAITQDANDNMVKTYYRYPTQHQEEYYERIFSPQRIN